MEDLRGKVDKLKKQGQIFSNIYSDEAFDRVAEYKENEKALIASVPDHGVVRLYFVYTDENYFRELLSSGEYKGSKYVIEFMTRNASDYKEMLTDAGFHPIAYMMRMSVRDCEQAIKENGQEKQIDPEIGQFADERDAQEIKNILWNIFDTRVSHLPDEEDVKLSIENKEITVYYNDSHDIKALLQAQVQPRKFYINQIYNSADKNIIHTMLQNRLTEYFEQGGKYVYAWVEKNNIASVKFHEKYGLKHDGMWNMVYSPEEAVK